jgi:hypothetical protein
MDIVVDNITEVALTKHSYARISYKDKEKYDFLLSMYGSEQIITDEEQLDEIMHCFHQGLVELLEEMEKYFNDLIYAREWFSHRIRYDGRRIFTATESEPFSEVYNPNSKRLYREAKAVLTSHLQYCIESDEVGIRPI